MSPQRDQHERMTAMNFFRSPTGSVAMLLALISFSAISCRHEPPVGPLDTGNGGNGGGGGETPCDPNIVYFQQQVLPILVSNCAVPGCHNTATDDNDWIQITDYTSLMNSGIVQDGDLMDAITDSDPDDIMPRPPQNPLTSDQISIINAWINAGAPNNSCTSLSCDTLNVTYSGTIRPLIQQRCQGCHSGPTPQGTIDLSTWAGVNAVVVDGRLADAIQHQGTAVAMPPGGAANKLPDCNIRQFLLWIEAGAPNN